MKFITQALGSSSFPTRWASKTSTLVGIVREPPTRLASLSRHIATRNYCKCDIGASHVPVIHAHEGTLSRTNQFQTFVFDVAEGNANFSATLVWSDPAAAMAAEVGAKRDER